MSCTSCAGLRHVLDPESGLWVVCDCLKKKRVCDLYVDSGIGREYFDLTCNHLPSAIWGNGVRGALQEVSRALTDSKLPAFIAISGKHDRNRSLAVALFIKLFIKHGKVAKVIPISRVFEVLFNQDQEYKSVNCLVKGHCICLELGYEITNPRTGSVAINIWRERKKRGQYTFFSVTESQAGVRDRYGKELYDLITDREQFKWVQIGSER